MANITMHGAVEAIDVGPAVSEDVGGVFVHMHLPIPVDCDSFIVDCTDVE